MSINADISVHNHGEAEGPRVYARAFCTKRGAARTGMSWYLDIDNASICCYGYSVTLLDECIEALQSIRDEAERIENEQG